MRRLFKLVLAFSLVTMPLTGCDSGPEEAGEEEAQEGMDDMDAMMDAASTEGGDEEGGGDASP